jgi:hypothetical protein
MLYMWQLRCTMLWRKKNVHVCLNTVMSYRNQNMFSIYKQQIDTMLWHWNYILTRNDEKNTNCMGHLHSDLTVFTSTIQTLYIQLYMRVGLLLTCWQHLHDCNFSPRGWCLIKRNNATTLHWSACTKPSGRVSVHAYVCTCMRCWYLHVSMMFRFDCGLYLLAEMVQLLSH